MVWQRPNSCKYWSSPCMEQQLQQQSRHAQAHASAPCPPTSKPQQAKWETKYTAVGNGHIMHAGVSPFLYWLVGGNAASLLHMSLDTESEHCSCFIDTSVPIVWVIVNIAFRYAVRCLDCPTRCPSLVVCGNWRCKSIPQTSMTLHCRARSKKQSITQSRTLRQSAAVRWLVSMCLRI